MALLKKQVQLLYSRIFSRPLFHNFNKFIFDLSIRGLGIYSHNSGENYFYSNLLPDIIHNSEPVIFDVGAHIGKSTLLFHQSIKGARIYSFEPNPKCFEKLKRVENENIKVFLLALGSEKTKIKLYDRKSTNVTQHSSIYKEVITDLHRSESVEYDAEMTTLDEICSRENIKYIDFLKIDTEGNDLFVLKGANNLLGNESIGCIQFEFNIMNVFSRTFFRDFIQILKDYDLYRMLPAGLVKLNSNILHNEIYGLQNIVAVKKNTKIY